MYKVERAIIMAAGLGKRMAPITSHTPKPLISVNGTRMIDSVISALHCNGIKEIYVVVGYMKEQFYPLKQKYEGVEFIENPFFDTCNNISSLYVARDYLKNVMILDADQVIYNNDALKVDFERSGYNAVWTDVCTKEWLLQEKGGIVTSCSRTGGERGWQLYSVSRWNERDGERLRKHIEIEFEQKGNREIYWDDIALFCYPEEYELGIFEMARGDILEIDSIDELIAVDKTYQKEIERDL